MGSNNKRVYFVDDTYMGGLLMSYKYLRLGRLQGDHSPCSIAFEVDQESNSGAVILVNGYNECYERFVFDDVTGVLEWVKEELERLNKQ